MYETSNGLYYKEILFLWSHLACCFILICGKQSITWKGSFIVSYAYRYCITLTSPFIFLILLVFFLIAYYNNTNVWRQIRLFQAVAAFSIVEAEVYPAG